MNVFTHCYVDVERGAGQWHALGDASVWQAFSGITKDIAKLAMNYEAPAAVYVFRSAIPCVLAYFSTAEDLGACVCPAVHCCVMFCPFLSARDTGEQAACFGPLHCSCHLVLCDTRRPIQIIARKDSRTNVTVH